MAKVVWTALAVEDLRQIHEFISKDSKQYAAIVVRSLRASAERLKTVSRERSLCAGDVGHTIP